MSDEANDAPAADPVEDVKDAEVLVDWMNMTGKLATALDSKAYVTEFWKMNTRPDGRIFGQCRQTTIVTGALKANAIGSALVKLENSKGTSVADASTHALAGVTLQVGQPTGATGDVVVKVVSSTSSSSSSLESWLRRLLLQVIDLEKLTIVPGESAFLLEVTIVFLNNNGNEIDVALLAALAALRDADLPSCVLHDGRLWLEPSSSSSGETTTTTTPALVQSKLVELTALPIPLSLGVWEKEGSDTKDNGNPATKQQIWIADPTDAEQDVCQGSLTLVLNGLEFEEILSMEYTGKVSLDQKCLALAVQMARGRAIELLPLYTNPGSAS